MPVRSFVLALVLALVLAFALGAGAPLLLDRERRVGEPCRLCPLGVGYRHRQLEVSGLAADERVAVVSLTIVVERRTLACLAGLELDLFVHHVHVGVVVVVHYESANSSLLGLVAGVGHGEIVPVPPAGRGGG